MDGTIGTSVRVGRFDVRGVGVGDETRCAHYGGERDVVAIAFRCCETFYPCVECHDAVADHDPAVWPRSERDERAVLCGSCAERLTIRTYLGVLAGDRDGPSARCPNCGAGFNPGCLHHVEQYFER